MASVPLQRLKDLFDEFAELPPERRDRALDAAALSDSTRRQLGELLAIDAQVAHKTARPALDMALRIAADADVDTRIGAFTIERELGRGGMGTVYLAQRAVPGGVQRVALKCLHRIGAAHEFERRFRSEISVLAQLSHPHIARLIDAGQEADGRCWIAMEFVEGLPLLEYCDQHGLNIERRLALFDTLCEAVSAAHRALVVHRDIKSSNVLVRADGELLLIDFGIARALDTGSDVTLPEQRFLSPLNAAPEQVRGAPTTTSCDVYGLGVVLYELLCGAVPINLDTDARGEAIRKAVLHQVPALLSARVRQLTRSAPEHARECAQRRACADGARLARLLQGDLEQICALTLRKEPHQRYASVDRLREDLQRSRAGLSILARGNDRAYRVARWARRHAIALTFASAAALALLAGVIVLWLQAGSLERERDHAREQTRLTQQQRQRAEFLSTFLLDAFEQADPSRTMGATMTAKQILDAGVRRVRDSEDVDPESRGRIALTLADVEYRLGLYEDGDELLGFSAKQLAAMKAPSGHLVAHRHYLEAIRARHENHWQDAVREANEGLMALGAPTDASGERLWIGLKRLRADGLFAVDDVAGMIPLYRELAESAGSLRWSKRSDTWDLRIRLAWALDQTEHTRGEALTILQDVLQDQATAHAEGTAMNAFALCMLGNVELHAGNTRAAREHGEQAVLLYRKVYGNNHPYTARALNWTADAQAADGNPQLAVRNYREAQRIVQAGNVHDDLYVTVQYNMGVAYDDGLHDFARAESNLRGAMTAYRDMLGEDNTATLMSESSLAYLLIEQQRMDEAKPLLDHALRHLREKLPALQSTEQLTGVQAALALVRHAQGDDREAKLLLKQALPTLRWYPMRNRVVLQQAHALAKTLHVSPCFGLPRESNAPMLAQSARAISPIGPR